MDGELLCPHEQILQVFLQGNSNGFARACGEQIHIGLGRFQQRLAGDPAELPLLLPELTLGVDLLVHRVAEIEVAGQLQAAKERAETGMDKRAVRIHDAALVPIVGRTDLEPGQPTDGGQIAFGTRFAYPRSGQGHLRILILCQAKDGVEINRQRPGGCWRSVRVRCIGGRQRGRSTAWWAASYRVCTGSTRNPDGGGR